MEVAHVNGGGQGLRARLRGLRFGPLPKESFAEGRATTSPRRIENYREFSTVENHFPPFHECLSNFPGCRVSRATCYRPPLESPPFGCRGERRARHFRDLSVADYTTEPKDKLRELRTLCTNLRVSSRRYVRSTANAG